jgi:hypothetical protein
MHDAEPRKVWVNERWRFGRNETEAHRSSGFFIFTLHDLVAFQLRIKMTFYAEMKILWYRAGTGISTGGNKRY